MNQYYRVYAAIDLDAICQNISEIKKIVGPDTKIMPVIKADGYGHGAVPVAKALNKIGVDGFAVAIIEEGIALRKQGITKPILILGYTSEYQYASLIQHEIEQTVFSYEMAEAISKFAVTMKKEAKIHIKVDTGMNRIGFKPTEESVGQVQRIRKLPRRRRHQPDTRRNCLISLSQRLKKKGSRSRSSTSPTAQPSWTFVNAAWIWCAPASSPMDCTHPKKWISRPLI